MSGKKPRPRRRDDFHEKKQDLLLAWRDEVCNSEELPEVEIVSLLQEHIPKYRLRADSLTEFGGYENQDWFIPSPALPLSDDDLKLTPDQIRETLNYFLLCSNRVSQMTKTYNDIEAVTRLLEEKEKDLELTARIGKELLTANGRLESRVNSLEGELKGARDLITQLRHDLHAKTELLQVLTNDTEESTPTEESPEFHLGDLRRRTGALERENRSLREEAARLAAGTDSAELAERQLLADIAHQLSSANQEANILGNELANERERSAELQEQLDSSNARLAITERNLQQITIEHEHTLRILEITKENQNALASELADAKERYAEVSAHLSELQEQLREVRKRGEPAHGLMPSVAAAAGLLPAHSLRREMHSSVLSELSLDSGIADHHQSSMHKIFETVQCVTRWSDGSVAGSDPLDHSSQAPPAGTRPPFKPDSSDSFLDESSDTENEDLYPGGWGGSGVPGAPGAAELAAALRRLTPQEISGRRALLTASHAPRRRPDREHDITDSMCESAVWGAGSYSWRPPSKLQIVKPMEGSRTLHTWAQLAKPNMSGLLEDQEGVGVRGSRNTSGMCARLYRLSDVEEDDDMPRLPHTHHIYTFTNSTVMHPNDGSLGDSCSSSVTSSALSSLSSSVLGSAWSSRRSSRLPSRLPSRLASRRSSANVSPDRSRRASLAPATPARRYSPTATPANSPLLGSPDASPPHTPRSSEPPSLHSLIAIGRKYLASPADGSSPSTLTLQTPGSLYTGLVHRSPMEQLTSFKRNLRSPAADKKEPSEVPLGQPAQTGSGALEATPKMGTLPRRGKVARAPRPRTDLGTVGVPPNVVPTTTAAAPPLGSTTLGTLSTFLFGRKGGLM